MADIKNLKTLGGEEVFGKLIKETEKEIVLRKPMVLQFQQVKMPTGEIEVQPHLVPYAPFVSVENIPFERTAVVFCADAHPEMIKDYIKATTGLTVAAPPGLILD